MISETYFMNKVTKIIILLFCSFIFLFILKRGALRKVHPLDFMLISTISFIPMLYVLCPSLFIQASSLMKIRMPFFLLFGSLILILFLMLILLASRMKKLEKNIIKLTLFIMEKEDFSQ